MQLDPNKLQLKNLFSVISKSYTIKKQTYLLDNIDQHKIHNYFHGYYIT